MAARNASKRTPPILLAGAGRVLRYRQLVADPADQVAEPIYEGDIFKVMTYASVNGTFGRVDVTGLPPGLVATAVYNPTSLSIVVGMALRAGGQSPGQSPGLPRLTGEQVEILLDATNMHRADAGLPEQSLDLLRGVEVRVTDLGGDCWAWRGATRSPWTTTREASAGSGT